MTAALFALLREGRKKEEEKEEEPLQPPPPQPLFMAAEINPQAAAACARTAKANKVRAGAPCSVEFHLFLITPPRVKITTPLPPRHQRPAVRHPCS